MYQVFFTAKDSTGRNRQFKIERKTQYEAEFAANSKTIDMGLTHFEIIQVRQICKKIDVNEGTFRVL